LKGDLPEPAFRLLTALPVTTHERDEPRHKEGPQHRGYVKRAPGSGPASICRPVRVGRRVFKSITEAKVKLRVSPQTLYAMLDDGRARYV